VLLISNFYTFFIHFYHSANFKMIVSKTSIKKTSSVTPVAVLPKRAKYHYRKKWTELSYFFN